jgi:poly(beta-D-mannuronate) lyase
MAKNRKALVASEELQEAGAGRALVAASQSPLGEVSNMRNSFGLVRGSLVAVALVAAGCSPSSDSGGTGGSSGSGGAAGSGGGGTTGGRGGGGGTGGSAGAGGQAGSGGTAAGGGPGTGGAGPGAGGSGGTAGGAGGSAGEGSGGTGGASGGSGGSAGAGGSGGGEADGGTMPPPEGSGEPPLPACKRTVMVANAGALGGALGGAMPGDCLVLADGDYPGPAITARGTAEAPIVVRAANRLKANMTGSLRLMGAAYVVVEGFNFPGGASAVIGGNSSNTRISRSRFFSNGVELNGTAKDNRVDRCEFGPKGSDGNLVRATGMSENTRIDRNYFHDISAAGGNGRETIVLGCCGAQFDDHPTGNIVELNLLVNASGEAEIISIKSSKNTVRYNTIRNSAGNLTLRAGQDNIIYGNYVFGSGNQGGIRAFDDNHRIFNNYIQTGQALIANRTGPIHAAVRNAIIVHNTFLGSVTLSGSNNTFANNITGGSVSVAGSTNTNNMTATEAGLQRMGEVMAITAGSKAINAGMGSYDFLKDDMNGQARAMADVGADELSTAPSLYGPLNVADVGPNAP